MMIGEIVKDVDGQYTETSDFHGVIQGLHEIQHML
jgi:hypothetical protein